MSSNFKPKSVLENNQQLILPKKANIHELSQLLAYNRQIQQYLKSYRDSIQERMQAINEYISTYRLKEEYPMNSSLNSYIRYEKRPPQTLKDQITIRQTELFRLPEDHQNNFQPQKNPKNKKKKQINLALLSKNPHTIHFQQLASSAGYPSGLELYRQWLEFNKVKIQKIPYTQEQQRAIVELQTKFGTSWQKISNYMQDRNFDDIYYQFHNRLNPKIIVGRWTNRQSLMLIILVEHFGTKSWSLIGQRMVIKSELQVRQRFCNMIDPNIGRDHYWTPEMEAALIEASAHYNFCWQKIARLPVFNNKTDNCIWRKFRELMIPKTEEEIRDIIQDNGAKGLADRIIIFKRTIQSRKRRTVPACNKKFDPNQRARLNRQKLQEQSIKRVTQDKDNKEASHLSNESKPSINFEIQESQPQYICYQ